MKFIDIKKTYSLQLANGHSWNIIATEGTETWVDKFAKIMQLKVSEPDESPKMIFVRDASEKCPEEIINGLDPHIFDSLPKEGWKNNKYSSNGNKINAKFCYNDKVHDKICLINKSDLNYVDGKENSDVLGMWLFSYLIYQREQFFGGLPFHAGLVVRDNKGILLSANGGTGKSTCCRRIPLPWQALGDDQALIVRDGSGKYVVHPFPTWSEHLWKPSDKTWNIERYVDLSAIFFLERSEYDEVIPLERKRSILLINEMAMQASVVGILNMDKEEERSTRLRLFNNSCELSKFVPTYILRVSLHGQFWKEIEKVQDKIFECMAI